MDSAEAGLISITDGNLAVCASAVTTLGKAPLWDLFPESKPSESDDIYLYFLIGYAFMVGLEFFPGRCWCWLYLNCMNIWVQVHVIGR